MSDELRDPDKLRRFAVDYLLLARATKDPEIKALLLGMAQSWAELATQAEKLIQITAAERKKE